MIANDREQILILSVHPHLQILQSYLSNIQAAFGKMYIIKSIRTNDIRYGGWRENYSQIQD